MTCGPINGQYLPKLWPFTNATPFPQPAVFKYVSKGSPVSSNLLDNNCGPLVSFPVSRFGFSILKSASVTESNLNPVTFQGDNSCPP